MEIDDGIAAFAWPLGAENGTDRMVYYDADHVPPGSFVLGTNDFPYLFVNRAVLPETGQPFGGFQSESTFPLDMSVHSRRIAFFIPESVQGADLNGNGFADEALVLVDLDASLLNTVSPATITNQVRLSRRWLAAPLFHTAFPSVSVAIGLFDVSNITAPPRFLYDRRFGFAYLP